MLSLLVSWLCAQGTPAVAPRNVYVGAYLNDVSDFDLKAGRFKADLRVWVKWRGGDAVPGLSFENGELDQKEDLGAEVDGDWHSTQWRVQGTFRGEFPVNDFPFDRQTLPIVIGLDEHDGVLVPDLSASGMSPSFSVTGWAYQPYFAARAEERIFRSDLGSVAREGQSARRRLVTYVVEVTRPFGPYLLKFALPLGLIVLVALLGLLLPADRLDVRSAMGITALLSCIAFHYTQADTLPAVTYLVAADKLFLASYVFVTVTLVLSVWSYRLHERDPAAARRADRLGLWLLPPVSLLALAVFVGAPLARRVASEPVVVAAAASQPVLRVAVPSLDTVSGSNLPSRRGALVVRAGDHSFRPELAVEAPAMTNSLVRLLPGGGMRVRWQLKANATWTDGAPITSDDLLFSLNLQRDALCTDAVVVDERTLEVTYAERRLDWLAGFTVFPQVAAARVPDGGREAITQAHQAGALPTSGPYLTGEFEVGQRATMLRNPRYVGPRPVYETIDVKVMSPLDAAKALLAGQVDVVPALTAEASEVLTGAAGVTVLEQPGELLWVVVPNLTAPPFDALQARQALLAAIDREAMVKALAPARTQVASGWRPSAPHPVPVSGFGLSGLSVTLSVLPIRSADATHAVLARRLVEDLGKAGVTVTVKERTDLRQAVQRGGFEGLALLSRDTAEPSRFFNVSGEAGRTGLDRPQGAHYDAELVSKYSRFKNSLYEERRAGLEDELQRAWFDRLPMLPLVLTSRLAAVRADLIGPTFGQADSLWWNLSEWRVTPIVDERAQN